MSVHESMVGQQFHQLPMFMTAREIRAGWQVLDGDREGQHGSMDWPSWSFKASGWTRTHSGMDVHAHHPKSEFGERRENDDEVFDRKREEADNYGMGSEDDEPTLYEDIVRNGVQKPVTLQDPTVRTRGSLGKPEILGGHHRIAVMDLEKPNTYMPVLFDTSLRSAKSGQGGYRYT
jgi:hypothetical protein